MDLSPHLTLLITLIPFRFNQQPIALILYVLYIFNGVGKSIVNGNIRMYKIVHSYITFIFILTLEILSRVQEFIDFLREKYHDKRILVITHAGIIYALQVALGLDIKPIDNLEELTINLSSKRLLKKWIIFGGIFKLWNV